MSFKPTRRVSSTENLTSPAGSREGSSAYITTAAGALSSKPSGNLHTQTHTKQMRQTYGIKSFSRNVTSTTHGLRRRANAPETKGTLWFDRNSDRVQHASYFGHNLFWRLGRDGRVINSTTMDANGSWCWCRAIVHGGDTITSIGGVCTPETGWGSKRGSCHREVSE